MRNRSALSITALATASVLAGAGAAAANEPPEDDEVCEERPIKGAWHDHQVHILEGLGRDPVTTVKICRDL